MLLDDAQRHPQSQARAGNSFGGKEWLEDAAQRFPGHAMAAISDGDANTFASGAPVCSFARAQRHFAAVATSDQRVADKVGEYLAQFAFKREQRPSDTVVADDLNARRGKAALIKLEHGIKLFRNANGCPSGRLAIKTQSLRGNLAHARQFLLRQMSKAAGLLRKILFLVDEVKQIGYSFKRIIDLMRNRSGEPADGSQLFTLQQR